MGPTSTVWRPYQRKEREIGHIERHRGEGCVKVEGQRDAATSQRMPRVTRSWERQGRILPGALRREYVPADAGSSDF